MKIKTTKTLYKLENVDIGIVHIGLGAFHRAHQAVYIEKNLNRNLGGNWGICSVNIRSNSKLVDQLKANDCRYHIAEYTDSDHAHLREVNAIRDVLFAGEDKHALFDRLASPNTKIVTLTVTEKGYYVTPSDKKLRLDDPSIQHDIQYPAQPKTAPGILVEALFRRKELGLPAFSVLSCDNMPNNGALTRASVCELAAYRSTDFAQWVQDNVAFPSSMVDRIVPAMSDESQKRLHTELNCDDQNAVMCEAFILNGSHSLLAYVGSAAKLETVADAVADPKFIALIRHYMTFEALPTLDMPDGIDVQNYIESLISRFANDSLQHKLSQIAMDGSQKIPQRWLAGGEELLVQKNLSATALGVAAWILYARGKDLEGRSHKVDDPMSKTLNELHILHKKPEDLIRSMLAIDDIFPKAFSEDETFFQLVLTAYLTMISNGVAACLQFDHLKMTNLGE